MLTKRCIVIFKVVISSTIAVLLSSIILYVIGPVFQLPHPTGSYEIGTSTYHWIDKNRPEIFTRDPNMHRELMIQIWYPAQQDLFMSRAPYLSDAKSLTASLARLNHIPELIFKLLSYVKTNAVVSAPVTNEKLNYPVLIFLEGANGFRQMNSYQVEELVSNGYIVVAIDQPYTAASVIFPDGREVLGLPLKLIKQLIRQSYSPIFPAPKLNGRSFPFGIINYLAHDVVFILDQLGAINREDPKGILTGKLNLDQVGIFGVSLGGIVASEACLLDLRLRACLVMDSPMPTSTTRVGLQQPTMWLTRDSKTMNLEGWPPLEIEEHQTTMRAAYENLKGDGYFVQIRGMFHLNLTDVPLWSPLIPWLGLSGPIERKRAHQIVNQYTLTFFDQYLKGTSQKKWAELNQNYPEVNFESHGLKNE